MRKVFSMTVLKRGNQRKAYIEAPHGVTVDEGAFAAAFALMSNAEIEFDDDEYSWLVDRLRELGDEMGDRMCYARRR